MADAIRMEADRRFDEALGSSGARDPRDFYRTALRDLREANPQGYESAVRHFQEVLVPSIANGEADPLRAWREYGIIIANTAAEGRTVSVDESGRAGTFESEDPLDRMVLHLPEAKGGRAIVVSLPAHLSSAQRATFDLLVKGKHTLSKHA